jgi:hypothetical protein
VRDAAGHLVGHLDFDDGGLVATSFCHDADRFVVGTEKALYAFHLPDGRRLARIPLEHADRPRRVRARWQACRPQPLRPRRPDDARGRRAALTKLLARPRATARAD